MVGVEEDMRECSIRGCNYSEKGRSKSEVKPFCKI